MTWTGAQLLPNRPTLTHPAYGIIVGISPSSDLGFDLELARAVDSTGNPFDSIARMGVVNRGALLQYTDILANSTHRYYYRVRSVRAGYTASAWTAIASAKPAPLVAGGVPTIDGVADGQTYAKPLANRLSSGVLKRGGTLDDGKYALQASKSDGTTAVSTALIPQGSIAPVGCDQAVGYQTGGPSSGAMWAILTPQSVTLTYADGTTDSMGAFAYPTPPTPSLSQVAGGAKAGRTYFVKIGYVKDGAIAMKHNAAESSLAVSASNLLVVASPASQAEYDGWVVFLSTTTGDEVCQQMSGITVSPIAFGTNWTEPTSAVVTSGTKYSDMNATLAGATVPCFVNLATSTTYYLYPYWDQSLGAVFFATGINTAKTTAAAIAQSDDGKTPVSTAAISVPTPGAASTGSGTLGGSGTCIAAGQLVETRHGVVPIETVPVGDEIAGRTGWTRVMRAQHVATETFVRVRLEDGSEVIVTPEHPFTVPGETVTRARELTVDAVLHTRTGYGRVVGISLEPAADCPKVMLTCEPEHEFWAGSEAPTVLVHNTQVVS